MIPAPEKTAPKLLRRNPLGGPRDAPTMLLALPQGKGRGNY